MVRLEILLFNQAVPELYGDFLTNFYLFITHNIWPQDLNGHFKLARSIYGLSKGFRPFKNKPRLTWFGIELYLWNSSHKKLENLGLI